MTYFVKDKAEISDTRRTGEGYVTARAKAVRSGVQAYRAYELGDAAIAAGFSGADMVRVARPSDEVFATDSAATFNHVPVTIGHPSEMVDASNWKEYAVGEVGSKVLRDGEWLALDLILKDAAAIAAYDGGMTELSAGYTAQIEFVDGADGYDAVMRNIRINHLALVDKGRANVGISDSAVNWGNAPLTDAKEVPEMEMKAVVFGDKAVNVAASDADALTAHVTALDKKVGELTAKLADAATELADAKSQILTDAQIQERAQAMADAMARRDKVKAKLGDAADKMSDAQIDGALAVIDANVSDGGDLARRVIGDAVKKGAQNPLEAFYAKQKAKK